jgi:hypothetical protein
MGFIDKIKTLFSQNHNTELWVEPDKKENVKHKFKQQSEDDVNVKFVFENEYYEQKTQEQETTISDNSIIYVYDEHLTNITEDDEDTQDDINIKSTENQVFTPTTYTMVYDNATAQFEKHIIYITTNNITTQFIIHKCDIVEYANEFYKIAIEQFVYRGCQRHELRVDTTGKIKVELKVISEIVNKIYDDYFVVYKIPYLNKMKHNTLGCGGMPTVL